MTLTKGDLEMEEKKLMFREVKKEKQYLICIAGKDGADDTWDIVEGREEAYEYIKNAIEFTDLERSFILVESAKFSDRKSIYAFMKYAESFFEDNFDIEDYVKGDWNEGDYKENNGIDSMFLNVSPTDRISMQELMDGNVNTQGIEEE